MNYEVVNTGVAPYEVVATCSGCGTAVWVGSTYLWQPGPGWRCNVCVTASAVAASTKERLRRAALRLVPPAPAEEEGEFTQRARQLGLLGE